MKWVGFSVGFWRVYKGGDMDRMVMVMWMWMFGMKAKSCVNKCV